MLLMLIPKRNYKETNISVLVDLFLFLFILCFILTFICLICVFLAVVFLCCTAIKFIYNFLCTTKYMHGKYLCQLAPCFAKNYLYIFNVIVCFILYIFYATAVYLLNYLHIILCFLLSAFLSERMFCSLCAVVNDNEIARHKHIPHISRTYFTLLLSSDLVYCFGRRYLVSHLCIYCNYCIYYTLRIYCNLFTYLGSRYVVCIIMTDGS